MKSETEEHSLEAKIRKLNNRLSALRDAARREEHASLLGKCFKYHNTYGGSSKPWWMYMRVTKAGSWLECVTFQKTSFGEIQIKQKETHTTLLEGYRLISLAEFRKAWRTLQREISKAAGKADL